MPKAVLIIPCYNEASRLQDEQILALAKPPNRQLILVDDGSTDETAARLSAIAKKSRRKAELLALEKNGGKGEAVRAGLRKALEGGAELVGFADADLSTPVEEVLRLFDEAERRPEKKVVLGSRVRLLGSDVRRAPARHYLGRIFATTASLALRLPVYDTQCGAKVFKRSATLEWALAEPFTSRWAFDVELLGRLLCGARAIPAYRADDFLEVPLRRWSDVKGSKLQPAGAMKAGLDLLHIARKLRRQRRR